ncbi:MAG: glycosyltransferase family 2 protein [Symploca sp. SIO2G7]|nr:glycosyltransferase family 2 protein [Symploca sp. SIO2G7]
MSSAILQNNPISLLIVIVNYRTPSLVIECLRSLVDEIPTLPTTNVVVVDNASGDGSVEQIGAAITNEGWEKWVSFIPSEQNGGYAYGNNLGIRPALNSPNPPAYVFLLNPDTIVRPGAIKILIEFMEKHPEVGIGGSGMENLDGVQRPAAFRFHTVQSELDAGLRLGIVSKLLSKWIIAAPKSSEPCPTDWVPGAGMMIRREVFESVGLMDEEYFLYFEETDFCLQAKRAGWSCWYVPQSRVVHFPGSSTGVTSTKSTPKRRPQYWFDSRRRYFTKNYGWLYAALADSAWIFGYSLWRVRQVIQGKPDNDPPQLLSDFLQNSLFVKGTFNSANVHK